MKEEVKRFLIIDGNNLLYSSHYASEKLPWKSFQGAIFLFLRVVISILKKNDYQKVLVVFDGGGINFRKSLLTTYKAQRESMPETLVNQMEILKSLLVKINLPYIQIVNHEADDIIASFVTQVVEKCPNLIFDIFTRDKDMLQLINQNTNILKYINGKITLYNQESFQQEHNFLPSSYVDYLSLLGDQVDNIEGVKGIGPVNAKLLIRQFSTLENIYQKINQQTSQLNIPEPIKILLEKNQELVFRNKKIIGLEKNISLAFYSFQKYDFNWEEWKNNKEFQEFCQINRFNSILKLLS